MQTRSIVIWWKEILYFVNWVCSALKQHSSSRLRCSWPTVLWQKDGGFAVYKFFIQSHACIMHMYQHTSSHQPGANSQVRGPGFLQHQQTNSFNNSVNLRICNRVVVSYLLSMLWSPDQCMHGCSYDLVLVRRIDWYIVSYTYTNAIKFEQSLYLY